MKGRTYRYMDFEAQYPFGYGLTYGDVFVKEAEAAIIKDVHAAENGNYEEVCSVKAVLKNDGDVDTDEVVQVYIKNRDSILAIPNPSLCGFKRVHVKAGEEISVEIPICFLAFTVVDEQGVRKVDGTEFELFVGTSQPDAKSIALTERNQ